MNSADNEIRSIIIFPVIYYIRIVFALLIPCYFFIAPTQPLLISSLSIPHLALIYAFASVYLTIQVYLHEKIRRIGFLGKYLKIITIIDFSFANIIWLVDPFPLGYMFAIVPFVIVGCGIQPGLKYFWSMCYWFIFLGPVILAIRSYFFGFHAANIIFVIGSIIAIAYIYHLFVTIESLNQQLKQLTVIDSLTNIANRRRFDEYLVQEWNRAKRDKTPLSLIMGDIDFFKLYNDNYGHQAGDSCLQIVANAIQKNLKRGGDLLARYGGEEFVIVLPQTNPKHAILMAESIRNSILDLKVKHTRSKICQYVTMSLGVSCMVPSIEFSSDMLIEIADKALYEGKRQQRNSVTFGSLQLDLQVINKQN